MDIDKFGKDCLNAISKLKAKNLEWYNIPFLYLAFYITDWVKHQALMSGALDVLCKYEHDINSSLLTRVNYYIGN